MEIETNRLLLRRWQASDFEPCCQLNADPRVMEFFPGMLTRAETEAMISTIEERITQRGFGLWAAEFTTVHNVRSRRVMEGIGMTYDAQDDFDHPKVPEHHPLKRHVLYRKAKSV